MTLPARRQRAGRPTELGVPSWTRDPLAEFDDLFSRIGRLLESTVGVGPVPGTMAWAPLADTSETDDAYVVEADLPGVKREDIDVEISARELVITGELKEREREGVLRRGTRRTGRFEYRALLPTDVKAEGINAALTGGVLTITVPKAEPVKSRHVEITSGD
jgi:HSP20 family protein